MYNGGFLFWGSSAVSWLSRSKSARASCTTKQLDPGSLKLVLEEPEPPSVPDAKEGEWPSAIELALEPPYLVPRPLLLDRMESLIQGRLGEWKDYAWQASRRYIVPQQHRTITTQ
jgi:hypothetical protein